MYPIGTIQQNDPVLPLEEPYPQALPQAFLDLEPKVPPPMQVLSSRKPVIVTWLSKINLHEPILCRLQLLHV